MYTRSVNEHLVPKVGSPLIKNRCRASRAKWPRSPLPATTISRLLGLPGTPFFNERLQPENASPFHLASFSLIKFKSTESRTVWRQGERKGLRGALWTHTAQPSVPSVLKTYRRACVNSSRSELQMLRISERPRSHQGDRPSGFPSGPWAMAQYRRLKGSRRSSWEETAGQMPQ